MTPATTRSSPGSRRNSGSKDKVRRTKDEGRNEERRQEEEPGGPLPVFFSYFVLRPSSFSLEVSSHARHRPPANARRVRLRRHPRRPGRLRRRREEEGRTQRQPQTVRRLLVLQRRRREVGRGQNL